MNVSNARVALRDRTLLDVLDLALRFVADNAGAYAKMSACVSIPALLVSWLAAALVGTWAGWALTALFAVLAQPPFVALASRLVFADHVDTSEALRGGLAALPRVLALALIFAIAAAFGAMFFILPALWLAVIFLFTNEIVVLERAGVGAAMQRMQNLVSGRFGDLAAAALVLVTLYGVAAILGEFGGRAILGGLLQIRLSPSDLEHGGPLSLLGVWLAFPVLTTARFFVYLNLRTRREGWDIQTRFGAIARREAERAQGALEKREVA